MEDLEKCNAELLDDLQVQQQQGTVRVLECQHECEDKVHELTQRMDQLLTAKGDAKYVALSDQVSMLHCKTTGSGVHVTFRGTVTVRSMQGWVIR